jgi:hypothetical protein
MTPAELEHLAIERLGLHPTLARIWDTLNDRPAGVTPGEWWDVLDRLTRTDQEAMP